MTTAETVDEYANHLFGGQDELLVSMRTDAEGQGVPMIHAPNELARLLATLVAVSRARKVLEIGTLFGLSAITMARELPEGGKLITLEAVPKHAAIARENITRAGLADRVEILEGPAKNSLARLQLQTFDLIFIDADKDAYPTYLDWALELSHPGTVIIADNVWRHGDVLHPDNEGNLGIAEFNRKLAAQPNLLSTIVPTRSGGDATSVSVVR